MGRRGWGEALVIKVGYRALSIFKWGIHTAISRKVVGKDVHATIQKGIMGYDQYSVRDTVAVKPTFAAFF